MIYFMLVLFFIAGYLFAMHLMDYAENDLHAYFNVIAGISFATTFTILSYSVVTIALSFPKIAGVV